MRHPVRWGRVALTALLMLGTLAFGTPLLLQTALGQRAWIFLLDPDQYYARAVWTDTSVHTQVPCPQDALVILTGGQSNAGNALTPSIPVGQTRPAYQWFDGACYRLQDPLLGADGRQGSLWTALGQEIAQYRAVVFINTARGATSYRAWLDWRSGYLRSLQDAAAIATAQGLTPILVLWHQGESEGGRDAPQWVYRRDLGWLMARLERAVPSAQILLYQASRCFSGRISPALRTAQVEVAQNRPKVFLGPDTDTIGDTERSDGCHFNGMGRDQIIAETVTVLASMGLIPQTYRSNLNRCKSAFPKGI